METRRIAVVGASDKTWRPSHGVFGFLVNRGYDTTPVNPLLAGRSIHGRLVVASLTEAAPLEMVDIFRASANAGTAVDEAIRLGARTVWMQLGVVDHAAAERARAAGLAVVMDRCPVIEVRRLGLSRH
jgi:predicted CoA-binding protein